MNTPSTRMPMLLLSLALISVSTAASAAGRAPERSVSRDQVTLKFRYDRRQLQTPEGARRVYLRLVEAARRECAQPGVPMNALRRPNEPCMKELVEMVLERAGSVQLAAVHRGNWLSQVSAQLNR